MKSTLNYEQSNPMEGFIACSNTIQPQVPLFSLKVIPQHWYHLTVDDSSWRRKK
jgi:hypothetical protein